MTQHFNDDNFQKDVIDASNDKPVLVDFFADWCGPCKMQAPIIDEVATSANFAIVGKSNTDEAMETAQKFGIMSIPTLLIFRNGNIVEKFIGVQHKDSLIEALEKYK